MYITIYCQQSSNINFYPIYCISVFPEVGYKKEVIHDGVFSYIWISEICCAICWLYTHLYVAGVSVLVTEL